MKVMKNSVHDTSVLIAAVIAAVIMGAFLGVVTARVPVDTWLR